MKPLFVYAVAWIVIFLLIFIFAAPLAEYLFMFMPLLLWSMLFAGGLLALLGLFFIRRDPARCGGVLAICLLGFTLYYSNLGFEWGRYALFQMRKSTYVKQLADAERLGKVPEEIGVTNEGPYKLHGFFWQRGFLDNWSAVVYDPTGKVAEINQANGMDEVRQNDLSELFGGTYYSCQDVGGGWYICWFT